MKNSNAGRNLFLEIARSHPHIVLGLQVHPEARLHSEVQTQAQRRASSDRTLSMHQFTNATWGHIDVSRELARVDPHSLHEVLVKDLAGVDFVKHFSHVQLLVIVYNFDVVRSVLVPYKAHAPLVVDADAALVFAVTFQGFQLVARRNSQAGQFGRGVQLQQLAPRHPFNVPELGQPYC